MLRVERFTIHYTLADYYTRVQKDISFTAHGNAFHSVTLIRFSLRLSRSF